MNTPALLALLSIAIAEGIAGAQTVDESKPYGRVCVAVAEAKGEVKPLEANSQPGPGKEIVVYLDSNTPCHALVVAFASKGGALANHWRPELVELGEWEALRVPRGSARWVWKTQESGPLDVQTFFIANEAPALGKVRTLIAAMARNENDQKLLTLQARQLRELVAPWLAGDSATLSQPESSPARIGGTVRAAGGDFSWRDFAHKRNFSAEKPGAITLRLGGSY